MSEDDLSPTEARQLEWLKTARALAAMDDRTARSAIMQLGAQNLRELQVAVATLLADVGTDTDWQTFIVGSALRRRLVYVDAAMKGQMT